MKNLVKFTFFILKIFLSDSHLMLTVFPIGRSIMKLENENLNLTCKVTSEENPNARFNISWKLPTRSDAIRERIKVYENHNELTVTIHNLQDNDSGPYICELSNDGIVRTKKISLFVKSKNCDKYYFNCGNGICIQKRFACDGHIDCPSGFDESFKHCGHDACYNKILCDGRCIPKEFCCDPFLDENCTVKYLMPCCQRAIYPNQLEFESAKCKTSGNCHFGQFYGYSNSMLYIVASSALVILIISGIILFLSCRICAKHSIGNRWPRSSNQRCSHYMGGDQIDTRDSSLHPLNSDIIYNGTTNISSHINRDSESPDDFVLVEFVSGSGYQIADCRPKPPPYSENTIGIPPPPYASRTDVSNINDNSVIESLLPNENSLNDSKQ